MKPHSRSHSTFLICVALIILGIVDPDRLMSAFDLLVR